MERPRAVILNYRVGPKSQRSKECLLKFNGIDTVQDAAHLVGRKVAWPINERKCIGKIVALHGKKGVVRARFRKGIPGQALGDLVELIG